MRMSEWRVTDVSSFASSVCNALVGGPKGLVELDILVETTGQKRWRSYAFESYLKLFVS